MIFFSALFACFALAAHAQQAFVCPAPNGIFPDFQSTGCTQFWTCQNCRPKQVRCANGEQFDYNRALCDRDANVQCNQQRRAFRALPGAPQCALIPPQNFPNFDRPIVINAGNVNPPITAQQCLTLQLQMNALFAQLVQAMTGRPCPNAQCQLPLLIFQC